jgi:hypothetical protein
MALRGRLERVGSGSERAGHSGADRLYARSLTGPVMLRLPVLGELLGHETGGPVKSDDCGEIEHWILLFPSVCYRLSCDSTTLPPLTPACQPVKFI